MIDINKKIYIIGDIDHEAFLKFTRRLSRIEVNSSVGDRVHIVLMSAGGEGTTALAFHDRIKMSPCKITITATGEVSSAAVLILAAGAYRYMTKNSWVMVHDDAARPFLSKDDRIGQAETKLVHARNLEDQWNRLLAESTKAREEIWDRMHREETYLDAESCLTLGLVDEII